MTEDQTSRSPFQVEAKHVLTATVMSAPASLAIAKTFWPETEVSHVKDESDIKIKL